MNPNLEPSAIAAAPAHPSTRSGRTEQCTTHSPELSDTRSSTSPASPSLRAKRGNPVMKPARSATSYHDQAPSPPLPFVLRKTEDEQSSASHATQHTGGVRKLRWKRSGMGKRGGLRVIYFVQYEPNEFWMLSLYAKAKFDNVLGHILNKLLEAFRDE